MDTRLPGWVRFAALVALSLAGLGPALAFAVWIEQNCALPQLSLAWGFPWIHGTTWSTAVQSAWNVGLITLFGVIHSGLAQPGAQGVARRVVPPQLLRTFYVVVTGFAVIAVMALWQSTGQVLWVLPLPVSALGWLSKVLFWSLLLRGAWELRAHDPLAFAGFRQIYASGRELAPTLPLTDEHPPRPPLIRTGLYGHVRHPLYAFTVAAMVLTPFLSLDRALVALGTVLYLAWGIPLEERKLRAQFGAAFDDYRAEVPALFPRLFLKR